MWTKEPARTKKKFPFISCIAEDKRFLIVHAIMTKLLWHFPRNLPTLSKQPGHDAEKWPEVIGQ